MTKKDHQTGPWSPAKAKELIRAKARDETFTVSWTEHSREQMEARDLIMGDALHVLKYGFVHDNPAPTSRDGMYKYAMECKTPNSGGRTVRVIVIPSPQKCEAKIITVMWADEPAQRS